MLGIKELPIDCSGEVIHFYLEIKHMFLGVKSVTCGEIWILLENKKLSSLQFFCLDSCFVMKKNGFVVVLEDKQKWIRSCPMYVQSISTKN